MREVISSPIIQWAVPGPCPTCRGENSGVVSGQFAITPDQKTDRVPEACHTFGIPARGLYRPPSAAAWKSQAPTIHGRQGAAVAAQEHGVFSSSLDPSAVGALDLILPRFVMSGKWFEVILGVAPVPCFVQQVNGHGLSE